MFQLAGGPGRERGSHEPYNSPPVAIRREEREGDPVKPSRERAAGYSDSADSRYLNVVGGVPVVCLRGARL